MLTGPHRCWNVSRPRDGGTLLVAAEDPDKDKDFFDKNGKEKKPRPDYCNRMRLYPFRALYFFG